MKTCFIFVAKSSTCVENIFAVTVEMLHRCNVRCPRYPGLQAFKPFWHKGIVLDLHIFAGVQIRSTSKGSRDKPEVPADQHSLCVPVLQMAHSRGLVVAEVHAAIGPLAPPLALCRAFCSVGHGGIGHVQGCIAHIVLEAIFSRG